MEWFAEKALDASLPATNRGHDRLTEIDYRRRADQLAVAWDFVKKRGVDLLFYGPLFKAKLWASLLIVIVSNIIIGAYGEFPDWHEVSFIESLWLASFAIYLACLSRIVGAGKHVRQALHATIDHRRSEASALDNLLESFSSDNARRGLFKLPLLDLKFDFPKV